METSGFGITSGVIAMVTGLIFLLVGIIIASEMNDAINNTMTGGSTYVTSGANATAGESNATSSMTAAWGIYANALSGLTIAGVALIIVGAAVILSVMIGFGR